MFGASPQSSLRDWNHIYLAYLPSSELLGYSQTSLQDGIAFRLVWNNVG